MDLCPTHGARSISELARCAIQNMIRSPQPEANDREVVETLHAIDKTVTEMNQNLKQLMPSRLGDNGRNDA